MCTIGLCGGEFGIRIVCYVNPKWDHWKNILGEFKVQSSWEFSLATEFFISWVFHGLLACFEFFFCSSHFCAQQEQYGSVKDVYLKPSLM